MANIENSLNRTNMFHVTATWEDNHGKYNQEMIICAPTKEEAEGIAYNHMPIELTNKPRKHTNLRTREYGQIHTHRTYYTSEPKTIQSIEPNIIEPHHHILSEFSITWGEIAQSYKETNTTIAATMLDMTIAIPLLEQWTIEYLTASNRIPKKEFFESKFKKWSNQTNMPKTNILMEQNNNQSNGVTEEQLNKIYQQIQTVIQKEKNEQNNQLKEFLQQIINSQNTQKQELSLPDLTEFKNELKTLISYMQDARALSENIQDDMEKMKDYLYEMQENQTQEKEPVQETTETESEKQSSKHETTNKQENIFFANQNEMQNAEKYQILNEMKDVFSTEDMLNYANHLLSEEENESEDSPYQCITDMQEPIYNLVKSYLEKQPQYMRTVLPILKEHFENDDLKYALWIMFIHTVKRTKENKTVFIGYEFIQKQNCNIMKYRHMNEPLEKYIEFYHNTYKQKE